MKYFCKLLSYDKIMLRNSEPMTLETSNFNKYAFLKGLQMHTLGHISN